MDSDLITVIGLLAAAFTTVSFLPQVIRIVKIRETRDISLMMYVILAAGVSLWLVYGILSNDVPIILANSVTLVFTVIVLLLKVRHG